jgi:hypothetical protein
VIFLGAFLNVVQTFEDVNFSKCREKAINVSLDEALWLVLGTVLGMESILP